VTDALTPDYAHQLLHTYDLKKIFYGMGSGLRQNLSFVDFKYLPVLIPPIRRAGRHHSLPRHINGRINRYIRAKRKLISLLNEQKQAIIQRAVTRGLDPDVPSKPTNISWLGDIPVHWKLKRLKYLASLKSGEGITSADIDQSGRFPVYGGNGLRGYTKEYTHDGDFVLIGRQGALCGNINYASGRFWASEHAVVASPRERFNTIWFGELLRIMNLNQYSIAAAQPGLSVERIQNLKLPVPPLSEQDLIEAHIGRETRGLELEIARTRRVIELIREYRAG
jgi:type I restriction enzyme, S subunit